MQENGGITSHLDLKTRLCLMAAFIYGTSDQENFTINKALQKSIEIAENLSGEKMQGNNNHNNYVEVTPSRLDLKTRLCLMAAFIYGASDQESFTVNKALQKAVEIENAADAMVRKMKRENPIPRSKPWRKT